MSVHTTAGGGAALPSPWTAALGAGNRLEISDGAGNIPVYFDAGSGRGVRFSGGAAPADARSRFYVLFTDDSWMELRGTNVSEGAYFRITQANDRQLLLYSYNASAAGNFLGIARANSQFVATNNGSGLAVGTTDGTPAVHSSNNTEVFRLTPQSHMTMTRRLQGKQGANVASASTLTLGADGNAFPITGTTTINHFTVADWQAGSCFDLLFSTSLTVTHNAGAPPGGTVPFLIDGAANFSATANDVLRCIYDGTVVRAHRIVI